MRMVTPPSPTSALTSSRTANSPSRSTSARISNRQSSFWKAQLQVQGPEFLYSGPTFNFHQLNPTTPRGRPPHGFSYIYPDDPERAVHRFHLCTDSPRIYIGLRNHRANKLCSRRPLYAREL